MVLPRLYAIIDGHCFRSAPDSCLAVSRFARELLAGGVTLIQYRNKSANAREILSHARELRRLASQLPPANPALPPAACQLIMNDRADLCLAAEFDGVHLGQDDLSPRAARCVLGDRHWIGLSTHNAEQMRQAEEEQWPVDYIAIGPVFHTGSKANPDPVIGLNGVRAARALTTRPLVAIGGITRANHREVLEAGADSVAVIGDLLREPRRAAEEFLQNRVTT